MTHGGRSECRGIHAAHGSVWSRNFDIDELCTEHLKYRLDLYKAQQDAISEAAKLIDENKDSEQNHIGMNYRDFRALDANKESGDNVDEWIQRNEKWMRVQGTTQGLVTLDDVQAIFPTATASDNYLLIPRRTPPPSSFCFFDTKRAPSIKIQPSVARYVETFNRLTNGVLDGLDWKNVFVAGGMALSTMLCVDKSEDEKYIGNDLDVYIYGLSPKEGNEKIKEIHNVWKKNIGGEDAKSMCIKNAKTVTFLGQWPKRRIQIILKLVKNPAEVLLNFDLDPCAMGFDGKDLLMLPRAARALETGYTTFTTHLVYGHHLGDRRATQETRLIKYASRGFGVRILPPYLESLTLDFAERVPIESSRRRENRLALGRKFKEDIFPYKKTGRPVLKGLKAVKRIAYMAEDMVRRFAFAEKTPMSGPQKWEGEFDTREFAGVGVPVISFRALDAMKQHFGQPAGKNGVKSFELLYRHAVAWRLEREGKLEINYKDTSDNYLMEDGYDDLPEYVWNAHFNLKNFQRDIDVYNKRLFSGMENMIDTIVNETEEGAKYLEMTKDTLPASPARNTWSTDIEKMFSVPLALPIVLPTKLKHEFTETYEAALREAGIEDETGQELFLSILPEKKEGDSEDSDGSEDENYDSVELWHIGNLAMWARLHRAIDEIYEILWNFLHVQYRTSLAGGGDRESWTNVLIEKLQRQIPRTPQPLLPDTEGLRSFVWPDATEKTLFELWMKEFPREGWRGEGAPFGSTHYFNESDCLKEPDEDLYWHSGDERGKEEMGWGEIEVGAEKKRKRKRVDSQIAVGRVAKLERE